MKRCKLYSCRRYEIKSRDVAGNRAHRDPSVGERGQDGLQGTGWANGRVGGGGGRAEIRVTRPCVCTYIYQYTFRSFMRAKLDLTRRARSRIILVRARV